MRTVVYPYRSYWLRKQKQDAAEQQTQRKKSKEPNRKVRNTLAYRFSGLSLELSCLATLTTVSDNQKNMLEDDSNLKRHEGLFKKLKPPPKGAQTAGQDSKKII